MNANIMRATKFIKKLLRSNKTLSMKNCVTEEENQIDTHDAEQTKLLSSSFSSVRNRI